MSQIITSKFLKQHLVCEDVIRFFENNFPLSLFPEGLDISKIEVTGDYGGYFQWINKLSECIFEYDSDGIIIKKTFPNGDVYEYEYNDNGKIFKITLSNNYIRVYKFEYNDKGYIVKRTYSNGIIEEYKYEYDFNGNVIKIILSNGNICEYNKYGNIVKEIKKNGDVMKWKYEYDHKGNVTKKTCSDGYINNYIFNYDSLGRLIQANNCHIKYLTSSTTKKSIT